MVRSQFLRLAAALLLFTMTAAPALIAGGEPEIYRSRGNLALGGYDAVAYFTDGKPVKGTSTFEYRWKDAVWRFATADHRDQFAKEPARFAPQFGGYCAYAVSQGHTASGDPLVWRVVNGKLYVNYSRQVATMWQKDIPGYIAKAEHNWPSVLGL
jgi:hypothetical protein